MGHSRFDKFYQKQLETLTGGVVVGSVYDGHEFFGLCIMKDNVPYYLWMLQDDEGNGPGSFEIMKGVKRWEKT
jgi:hypothetical protein